MYLHPLSSIWYDIFICHLSPFNTRLADCLELKCIQWCFIVSLYKISTVHKRSDHLTEFLGTHYLRPYAQLTCLDACHTFNKELDWDYKKLTESNTTLTNNQRIVHKYGWATFPSINKWTWMSWHNDSAGNKTYPFSAVCTCSQYLIRIKKPLVSPIIKSRRASDHVTLWRIVGSLGQLIVPVYCLHCSLDQCRAIF